MHARYAQYARIFFLSGFVSVENKERCIYLPSWMLRVRSPSPAQRFLSKIRNWKLSKANQKLERSCKRPLSFLCVSVSLQGGHSQRILGMSETATASLTAIQEGFHEAAEGRCVPNFRRRYLLPHRTTLL